MSVSQTSPVVLSGDFGSVVVIIKSRSSLSSSLSLYDSCCCWWWGGWPGEGHAAMLRVVVANMNSKYVKWFSRPTAPPIVGTVFTLSKCQPTPTTLPATKRNQTTNSLHSQKRNVPFPISPHLTRLRVSTGKKLGKTWGIKLSCCPTQ